MKLKPIPMQKTKMLSYPATEKQPERIQINDMKGHEVCIIGADGILDFLVDNLEIEEVEHYLNIAKQFHTFHNAISEKDQEINDLRLHIVELRQNVRTLEKERNFWESPVTGRQKIENIAH